MEHVHCNLGYTMYACADACVYMGDGIIEKMHNKNEEQSDAENWKKNPNSQHTHDDGGGHYYTTLRLTHPNRFL